MDRNAAARGRKRGATTREEEESGREAQAPRIVKRDPEDVGRRRRDEGESSAAAVDGSQQDVTERRVLRSKYLAVKSLINDERDNISGAVSDKFKSILGEVESLHHLVQKPREQVADAEALLDIANTLVASVKSQISDGATPSDFITSLLREFPPQNGELTAENLRGSMNWGSIGQSVSNIFKKVRGCSTMLGPMNMELKQRKVTQRKRTKPAESSRPEELDDNGAEEKTDTDKNMATMFNVLRRKRSARLEHLIFNRISFAQTVENLFALSFLIKDGRVEISVDDNGHHLVLPRNAPAAAAVASGEVSYSHFVFRFDFNDWKLMMDYVREGEELMPHRTQVNISTESEIAPDDSHTAAPTTPIRKLCRNRGLVIQEESVVEDSPDNNNGSDKRYAIRKGKRKIQ